LLPGRSVADAYPSPYAVTPTVDQRPPAHHAVAAISIGSVVGAAVCIVRSSTKAEAECESVGAKPQPHPPPPQPPPCHPPPCQPPPCQPPHLASAAVGSARVAPPIVATAVAVIAILLSAVRIVSSNFLQKIIA
jgi:hypothetical protein